MALITKGVRVMGWIALLAGFALILVGYIGVFLYEGLGAVLDLLSPYAWMNFLVIAATLAPGLLLLRLANWLEERGNSRGVSSEE